VRSRAPLGIREEACRPETPSNLQECALACLLPFAEACRFVSRLFFFGPLHVLSTFCMKKLGNMSLQSVLSRVLSGRRRIPESL
jgi:hypothetical protein